MKLSKIGNDTAKLQKRAKNLRSLLLTSAIAPALMMHSGGALAQQGDSADSENRDVIVVQGIRRSLANALDEKRQAPSIVEVIQAEDIGKLPDQNLAEVLENITGIQITRTAGVGTGVQIRGTNANRVEINGVGTVSSGSGRNGINFEDINPAIISAVVVTKASEAKTIEGSVGGTINLRTLRPLELNDDLLASVRIQGETNNLSTTGIKPRFSGALGKNWSTGLGDMGFVFSGSYTEQEAVSFRPRADRDNIGMPPGASPSEFLGIQFLVQEQENDDYETINLAGTFEWQPVDNLKLHFDAVINDQERSRDQYRLQASGISSFIDSSIPTAFETVDFGVGPGTFPAALAGMIGRNSVNDDNGNLRFTSETGSRVTDSKIFSTGGEWQHNNLTARVEFARVRSDTTNPTINTTLNFINPNGGLVSRVESLVFDGMGNPIDEDGNIVAVGSPDQDTMNTNVALGGGTLADAIASVPDSIGGFIYNDNSTPFVYDLSGNALAFGIDFNSPYAPTPEQLLDPNNVVLDQVDVGQNMTNNAEDAFRLDFNYDFVDSVMGEFLTSIDIGYRYNKSSSRFEDIDDRIGGFSALADSPNGALFQELLVEGPSNFNAADGRSLFISNFLLIDPDLAFSDPQRVLDTLQAAVVAHDPGSPDILDVQSDQNSFFDVTEKTHAAYGQANFASGVFRGNVGLRYVRTNVDSVAFGPADAVGNRTLVSTLGSYDFILPRFNLVANPTDDLLLRFAYGSDIRRPDFNDLNTGFTFDPSENAAVSLGNPNLLPEKVDSIDVSAEWYFAPGAIISVGYFTKDRTNIFGQDFEGAAIIPDATTPSGNARETDPNCPGGGIFNPDVIPNVLGDPTQLGLCVDFTQPGNDPAVTTQEGLEVAFQYSFADWEDRLGWASGFGVVANFTHQTFSGGSEVDTTSGRGFDVLGDVSIPRGLLDFSQNAYNVTAFYEKYGLSARARWTWREGFRTNDFGGGANTSGSSTFSFPVHTLSRGQLNASINYAVTDSFSVGVEAVNLTKAAVYQHCVSETGPLCFVGYPDRRIVFGGSYTF